MQEGRWAKAAARLCLLSLVAALSGCKLVPPPDVAKPAAVAHPKWASYAAMGSNGAPFVRMMMLTDSTTGLGIDSALVRELAQYDYVVMEPFRSGINADAQRLLKSLNPRMSLLAYVPVGRYFVCGYGWAGGEVPYGCDTTAANMRWSLYAVARQHNAILYGKGGRPYDGWLDFAQPGFAEALAETVAAWVAPWNSGAFVDETCVTGIRWTQGADSVDYRRAGYESLDAWDSAYRAGYAAFFMRLRSLLGNNRTLVGNCGPVGDPAASGWAIENFPHQRGGTVAEYLARETSYVAPPQNWLSVWGTGWTTLDGEPTMPDSTYGRAMRYALGVASLGSGVAAFPWSASDPSRGFWPANTVPEMFPKGWLGVPQGPAVRGKDGLWRRVFTGGSVTVDESRRDAAFERGK